MDKDAQDKNTPDQAMTPGQDADRYNQGYGSFKESDFDKEESHTSPAPPTGSDKEEAGENKIPAADTETDTNSTAS